MDILNAPRVGELKSEHIATLIKKVIKEFKGELVIEKNLRIYATNEQVTEHNIFCSFTFQSQRRNSLQNIGTRSVS